MGKEEIVSKEVEQKKLQGHSDIDESLFKPKRSREQINGALAQLLKLKGGLFADTTINSFVVENTSSETLQGHAQLSNPIQVSLPEGGDSISREDSISGEGSISGECNASAAGVTGETIFQVNNNSELRIKYLKSSEIEFNPFQTRESIDEKSLSELAESIRYSGLIQPILVREVAGGYELVAGERRLRAVRSLGVSHIPAIICSLTDRESLEHAIVENAQREDLDAVEEARGYQLLHEKFGLNHSEIAKVIGKNRSTVSNALRLLQLPEEILLLIIAKDLSAGHARALLSLEDRKLQLKVARFTVKKAFSVRALEDFISRLLQKRKLRKKKVDEKLLASIKRSEKKLGEMLEIDSVRLAINAQGQRTLKLVFDSETSWKRFMATIRG